MFGRAMVLAVLVAGCAGAHFDGVRFTKPGVAYRVGELGPAWHRVEVEDNDLAFSREGQGTVSVNATCEDYDDVPHPVLLNHLLFGTTQRTFVVDEEVTVDGRGSRHAIVDCELDGVPVRAEVFLITRGGCVFDLAYISGPSAPAHDVFVRFVSDFRVLHAPGIRTHEGGGES